MRNRYAALALLLALTVALPASAQFLDSRPDVICFYTDQTATRAGLCTVFTAQSLYLMITNPSDDSGLTSYGCSFIVPMSLFNVGFDTGGGLIIGGNFPNLDVGYATPRPAVNDAYLLATWTVMASSPAMDIVQLGDHYPTELYRAVYTTVDSTDPIAVTPPDWGNGMPMLDPWRQAVLWLNEPVWCGLVTPAESSSWGAIKATFR
ncbi:MAG: hypothetical protein IPH48_15900 [bacterium]|nr:hypothetical protein [bacterium]